MHNSPEDIAARTAGIYKAVLRDSGNIKQPDFQRLGTDDLACLFGLYDGTFFGGWLARSVQAATGLPLGLRLSATMTRAGGKTLLYRQRTPGGKAASRYEIAIASRMLFMTFRDVDRPVVVCGLPCRDRLEALQRIFEHEMVHLAEWVVYGKSSCSARRFKALAGNVFGHTDTKHALVTPREHAAVLHGISSGSWVEFDFEGRRRVGRVSRVHQRATVLVEDPRGMRYSDGKKYQKFYVPLGGLRPHRPGTEIGPAGAQSAGAGH